MDTKSTRRFSIHRNEAHSLLPFSVFDAETQQDIAMFGDKEDAVLFVREKLRHIYTLKMNALMNEMLNGNAEYLSYKALHDRMCDLIPDYYP